MSRSRKVTEKPSEEVHEEKQTVPCNRYRCPYPLSDFNLTEWTNWAPPSQCEQGQKVWRQRKPIIPPNAYHADGKIEIVSLLSQK